MKKLIITKVLFACFIMAVGGFVLKVQAQDIVLEFLNPEDKDYGSSNDGFLGVGLGGSRSGAISGSDEYWAPLGEERVEFRFQIGPTGQVGLDVFTPAGDPVIIDILNTWDNAAIGAVTNAALYGKSFTLILTAESRMQLGKGGDGNLGGIGVRGKNQRKIDDSGDNLEWMEFELVGDVGIDFVRLGYIDVAGGDAAVAVVKDHNTDSIVYINDEIDGIYPHPDDLFIDGADFNMRYFTDILHFTTTDSSSNEGYKLFSLEFNIVEAAPKPPAVSSTTPPNGDSLTLSVTDPYVIEFDAAVDQAASAAAVTISPAVAGRVNTWSVGDVGDVLTISYDALEFETWYEVVLSEAVLGTNGLNMDEADTITFKTLPEPPKVATTFPAYGDENVPIDAPISIEFTKSMVDTTVEQNISFNPEITGMSFVWNDDNTAVYISSNEMAPSNMYFGTVDVGAMDEFEINMSEPYIFFFTTALTTSVDNSKTSEFIIFPNPADDILSIRGVDVKSVKIYNMTGQLVSEIFNKTVLNVSNIETGIYVIDVKDRNDNGYKELILIK
ncbi:MAG: T9SS type A sorting domain-containing protein [Gammaproteobacteria bacterium]|nr:T9SS type A sorting domain-containing protein [Gammaproteobacteria bacterium]